MKEQRQRFLCAVCALALLLTAALSPAAWAAGEDTAAPQPQTTLTADDAAEMQQADEAVTALTDSEEYEKMSRKQRLSAALAQLDDLIGQGLVRPGSVCTDEENGMVSFTYSCGVLGGILLVLPEELPETTIRPGETDAMDEENSIRELMPLTADVRKAAAARREREKENALPEQVGTAAIYYAFDNTVNSTRFPYYSYMAGFWEGMGMKTTMNTHVTLADLRRMDRYDLCILSAHGSNYTYTYGLLRKRAKTEPIILLTEESTFYKDIIYSFDLLAHRVIKVNGLYCVTADFFRNSYRSGQLSNTIVYSETCEFLGVTGNVNESMAEALLQGGARAVLGYVNNVYTVYSRSMLWDTVNHLLMGQTIGEALDHAKTTYGENDIIWYTEQGGKRPHAAAACLILYGDQNASIEAARDAAASAAASAAALPEAA